MLRTALPVFIAGLAILSSGCGSIQDAMYKDAIEKALHEDALTGKQPTAEHVAAMRNVDMSNCPPDFREAYMKHIHAWEQEAAVYEAKMKLDNDEDGAAVAGVLATLFDSDATPWSDHVQAEQKIKSLAASASEQVSSTWRDIETIASRYGAKAPQ